MDRLSRVANVALSLLMIASSVLLMVVPQFGLILVTMGLGIGLVIFGVRKLVYFITMARHMVGGLSILFVGVIAIDMGVYAFMLVDAPTISVTLYLVGSNAFMGVIGVVHAIESKTIGSPWKASLAHGIVNLLLAAACLVFIGSPQVIIVIFCIGLIYGAFTRLVSAFKPAAIIYIQ